MVYKGVEFHAAYKRLGTIESRKEKKVALVTYERQPEKTTDIWRRYHWFSRQLTSEKRAQKFHTETCHYPDLDGASNWSCRVGNLIQPIRSTTEIWIVTRHQYGISALVSQTSFGGETSGSIAKCRLFSQAITRGCLTGKIWVFWISGRLWEVSFFFSFATHQCKFQRDINLLCFNFALGVAGERREGQIKVRLQCYCSFLVVP